MKFRELLAERSKNMLDSPTPIEVELSKKLDRIGVYYIRQHVISPYIVDFYIPGRNLIIEADGKIHLQHKDYDAKRDKYLKSLGYRIIRLSGRRVFNMKTSELRRVIFNIQVSKRSKKSVKGQPGRFKTALKNLERDGRVKRTKNGAV